MRTFRSWVLVLAISWLAAGCGAKEPIPSAPAAAVSPEDASRPNGAAPDKPLPAPFLEDGAAPAPFSPSWPPGWTVTAQGTIHPGEPEAAWIEVKAPGTTADQAVAGALKALVPHPRPDTVIGATGSPDGMAATGQVRGPRFKAVVTARREGQDAHLKITFHRGNP